MGSKASEMVIFFVQLLLVAVFAEYGGVEYECPERRCGHYEAAIRFPFWLRGKQTEHCGYPGFDLYCNDKNQTVMELPPSVKLLFNNMNLTSSVKLLFNNINPTSSLKLLVQYINYTSQQIEAYVDHDEDCYPIKIFPNLNFSSTPFQFNAYSDYDYRVDNYTIFNCPSNNSNSGWPITCLSLPGYNVYACDSDDSILNAPPFPCTKIFNFSIPYYEYIYLNWSKPICGKCEAQGKKCILKKNNRTEAETECFGMLHKPPKGSKTTAEVVTGSKTMAEVVTGVILGFFLLLVVIILLYRVHRSYKIKKENQAKIEIFLEDYKALKPTRYSFADIKRITNQFKEKLGQGGYGIVFKGKLSNEILVAVKILNDSVGNGEEFINEVRTMGTIHHVNVVRLVGYCADGFKRALIYEFLPNESLEKFIFLVDDKKHFLGWEKLQDIALGIAKGIEYLHQGCDRRILHFDIKPHNILLDHNFNPKICDFGLAKLCSKGQSAVSMTAVRGTMGYIAPEVLSRNFGNVSYKSDVYSFGMLLLEMVGGRKNNDVRVENTSQVYFPEWIYNRLNESEDLQIRIEEEGDTKIAKKLTTVGLWSIQWNPIDRPSMNVVVQMLEGDGDKLTMPPNPFTYTVQTNSTTTKFGRPFSGELAIIPESN